MASSAPVVLLLGHCLIKQLHRDLLNKSVLGAGAHFNLQGAAQVYYHGVGGRTVAFFLSEGYAIQIIKQIGPGCFLATTDVKHALRLIPQSTPGL